MGGEPFRLKVRAGPEGVTKTRDALTRFACECGVDQLAVSIVISELVDNAVRHAYPREEPGWVLIRACSTPHGMLVTVADKGCGMGPLPENGRNGLGVGLVLSMKLTDELRVESDERGTTVEATFPLV